MKRLLLVLVLANVLMFGWGRGWFDSATGSAVIGPEENAHRLRPVPLSRLAAPEPVAKPAPPAIPPAPVSEPQASATTVSPRTPAEAAGPDAAGPAPASSGTVAAPAPSPPDAPPQSSADDFAVAPPIGPVVCHAFSPIDEERAQALRAALEESGASVDEQRIEQGASYLVYLPPAASVDEAQRNLLDARRAGRDDAFVIQDGPMRLAVSLGLFRFESTARVMVEQLARAGETRALVAPRPPIQVRIALQARWPQLEDAALATTLGAQFNAEVRDCP